MKKILFLLFIATFFISGCNKDKPIQKIPGSDLKQKPIPQIVVSNFEECIAAGNPAMESYPRQCTHNDKTFTEEIDIDADLALSSFSHTGELKNVSGGEATGTASANYLSDRVNLSAEFINLPELEKDFFYEGWLVRKDPFHFISTGKAKTQSYPSYYMNYFESQENLDGYDFYILTLEPDDGDPAPADHILEGSMQELATEGRYYCDTTADCVVNKQCHPDEYVNKKYAPDNISAPCTASCEGPIDCGAGYPDCKNNVCVIVKGNN